jgi:hypothetical protein
MAVKVATWGNQVWPWFLIVVTVAFLSFELYALFTNTANTLSDYAWRELHLSTARQRLVHNAAWFLTQGAYLVTIAWLWQHIWYHRYT